MKMGIRIIKIEKGKNINWLLLKAYVDSCDKNKEYTIEYCFTDIESKIPLTDKQNECLLSKLKNDFGCKFDDIDSIRKKVKLPIYYEV